MAMKFHEFNTTWAEYKRARLDRALGLRSEGQMWSYLYEFRDPFTGRYRLFEAAHEAAGRPYYDVYPCIIPMFKRLDLAAISCDSITRPQGLETLVLRFPTTEHGLTVGGSAVRLIWLSFQPCPQGRNGPIGPGLTIGIDFGERLHTTIYTMRVLPLVSGRTIEEVEGLLEADESLTRGVKVDNEDIRNAMRMALLVCLIGNEPELVSPLVLNADQTKYDEADAERRIMLVDKARRRGKFGFALGAGLEVIPHYRRPHLALYHVGRGRADSRVVLRKGSLIHANKIKAVPTGMDRKQSDGDE